MFLRKEDFGFVGLYDGSNSLVIPWPFEEHPELVVQHELTHANLVGTSHLGMIEQALRAVIRAADELLPYEYAYGVREGLTSALLSPLIEVTRSVHESVAWTVGVIAGTSDYLVPEPYRENVARLTKISNDVMRDDPVAAMDLAERIGQLALSPLMVGSEPKVPHWRELPFFVKSTSRGLNAPDERFANLMREAERQLADDQLEPRVGGVGPETFIEGLGLGRQRSFKPSDIKKSALQIVEDLFAIDQNFRLDAAVKGVVEWIVKNGQLDPSVDPHLQAVLIPRRSQGRPVHWISPRIQVARFRETRPWDLSVIRREAPVQISYARAGRLVAAHTTDIDVVKRVLLETEAAGAVPIVGYSGYNLFSREFNGVCIGSPHVVFAVVSPLELILEICLLGGVAGSPFLEYGFRPAQLNSPMDGLGFFLVRARDERAPVIVSPVLMYHVSTIEDTLKAVSQHSEHQKKGVTFSPVANPVAWLGSLAGPAVESMEQFMNVTDCEEMLEPEFGSDESIATMMMSITRNRFSYWGEKLDLP